MANHAEDSFALGRCLLISGRGKSGVDAGQLLSQVAGVCFAGGHEGLLDLGTGVAEINLAADGSLRFRADTAPLIDDLAALHASSQLPGNIRFARDRRGSAVVADTQIDGAAHLPRTLQWLREGLRQALHPDTPPTTAEDAAVIERRDVEQALGQLPWGAEGLVEQEYGWELRPRIRGDAVPVRIVLERTYVGVTRTVLRLPEAQSPAAAAIADQAIRFNDQLRHARLTAQDGHVVAEARLHGGLIERGWLCQAAYAVAHAGRHAATPLRILAEQPLVAETYVAVFCSTVEQPALHSAGL